MASTGTVLGFDALDLRPVARWLSGPGPAVALAPTHVRVTPDGGSETFVDQFGDTPDWRLYRAGFVLRLRPDAGGGWSAALDPVRDELLGRLPTTPDPWPGGLDDIGCAAGPVADRVRAVAGRQVVRTLFEVSTTQELLAVRLGPATAGQVRLAASTIGLGPAAAPAELHRVEVSAADGDPVVERLAEAMAAACGLRRAQLSVFEAGLLTTGLAPPQPRAPVVRRVGPESTVGDVAFAALERSFAVLVGKEPGTRLGDDPEELHDMRVATRRMRAAMRLFEPALPVAAKRLREELGWLASALGAVRDLDVQLGQLTEWIAERPAAEQEPIRALDGVLRARRGRARARLLAALDSRRYERLLARFEVFLARGPVRRSPAANQRAVLAAPALLERHYRRVVRPGEKLTPSAPPAAFHRVRIRCKRLRYALEFLTPVYGAPAQALARRLVVVQDVLGRHQDDEVAIEHLRGIVAEGARGLPPLTVFEMGRVAERYARDAARQRRRFKPALRGLEGKPWRELERAMDRRRGAAAVPPAPRRRTRGGVDPPRRAAAADGRVRPVARPVRVAARVPPPEQR